MATGSTGTGKTALLCAIGLHLCRHGVPVRYFRTRDFLESYKNRTSAGQIRYRDSLKKFRALIFDDFGVSPFNNTDIDILFEILTTYYGKTVFLIGTQVDEGGVIADMENIAAGATADAVIDRLSKPKLAETLLMAGIRVLLSDTVKDPVEADRAYRARFQVEESFTDYKQRSGGRRVRTSTDRTTCGKIFTLFVATAIATMLRFHISRCEIKGEKLPVDSDREILEKLKSLRATVWEDGMYYSEVVGKKRLLLEALDIPLPATERFSKEELIDMGAIDQESKEDDESLNTIDDLALSVLAP